MAKDFLEYVNANVEMINSSKELTAHLLNAPWMPVLENSAGYPDFPHREFTKALQAPFHTRAAEDAVLLSSKYYILDGVLASKLQTTFGWQVSADDVFEQLLCLSQLVCNVHTFHFF
jgi:hypothetical protein